MHFVVDGYNVIRQSDALAAGSLRDQRERLLRFIEERRPQGSPAHRVTVVFDGRADVSSPAWPGPTRVFFSHGKDADALIKSLVDESASPRDAVVVTDDRAIQRWVRAAGARVWAVADFLAAGAPAPGRRSPGLSAADRDAINDELRDLWKLK
jgi:predicted RNA-binding protein with PIN domain